MFFRNDDLFFTVILMFSRQVIRGDDILKHFGKIQNCTTLHMCCTALHADCKKNNSLLACYI